MVLWLIWMTVGCMGSVGEGGVSLWFRCGAVSDDGLRDGVGVVWLMIRASSTNDIEEMDPILDGLKRKEGKGRRTHPPCKAI